MTGPCKVWAGLSESWREISSVNLSKALSLTCSLSFAQLRCSERDRDRKRAGRQCKERLKPAGSGGVCGEREREENESRLKKKQRSEKGSVHEREREREKERERGAVGSCRERASEQRGTLDEREKEREREWKKRKTRSLWRDSDAGEAWSKTEAHTHTQKKFFIGIEKLTEPSVIGWEYTLNMSQSAFTCAAPGSDSAPRNLALVNQAKQPRPPDCAWSMRIEGGWPTKQCYRTSGCNRREGEERERERERKREGAGMQCKGLWSEGWGSRMFVSTWAKVGPSQGGVQLEVWVVR